MKTKTVGVDIADGKHILIDMCDVTEVRYACTHKAYTISNDVNLNEILDLLIEYGY